MFAFFISWCNCAHSRLFVIAPNRHSFMKLKAYETTFESLPFFTVAGRKMFFQENRVEHLGRQNKEKENKRQFVVW